MRGLFDIEANGLLDETTINYLVAPFRLKPTYRIWCAVVRDIDTGAVFRYVGEEELQGPFLDKMRSLTMIVGHNIIDYDLLCLKLAYGIEYEIGEQCTFEGKPVEIVDTLVMSKTLNPDRYDKHGQHSLDAWGGRVGLEKIDWRARAVELGLIPANAPKGAEFAQYHPEMLVYCERDTEVNVKAYWMMVEEMGSWNWADALSLEHMVRDIITRQSHRGFWFDSTLAAENIRYLDEKMESIRQVVEPLLPPKPMGLTKLKNYMPPKVQFKKNGEPSENIKKWVVRHGGTLVAVDDGEFEACGMPEGKNWKLPMDCEVPIVTHEPSTVKDTTFIKGWLVSLGWKPTQYKERDLTCDTKKNKLSPEKFEAAVRRWVEQTLESPFCQDRLDELDTTKKRVLDKLLKHDIKRPLKVYTNPTLTVGQEKEIDPALVEFAKNNTEFPHAQLVSEFLTYQHRRNSILGGGFDPDDIDEDDEFAGKGFLAAVREDGRIPTPADTCGAATSRFKHKLVANIPRITSLFGDKMRGQFGVDVAEGYYQMGYDFASLEAMIESHYCWKYDDELHSYCLSLTREKPFDVHTITAAAISAVIGQPFGRQSAKPVKYACAYGAQPPRVAKTIGCSLDIAEKVHAAYWEAAKPLAALADKLKEYWTRTGGKKFILGLDGRKIPTRSASALINSLFQSAGVICAKRAMVLHEKKMKEAGLIVDFFREDWKAPHVQQLIAYHDEAQLEVHKSFIKWKLFETEQAAKDFKAENPGWSEIGHSDKGHYIGWCEAGVMIQEAVRETSTYYHLNVTLSADYILGRTWRECH
jgi:hypothetical protein